MLQVLLGRARGKAGCVTGNESREKPCHPGQTSSCAGRREGGPPGQTYGCTGRGLWGRRTREALNRVGEGWLAYRDARGKKKTQGRKAERKGTWAWSGKFPGCPRHQKPACKPGGSLCVLWREG